MPIVSRIIDLVTEQRDGSVRVREIHTDALGRKLHARGARSPTLAEATVRMNTRDFTRTLKKLDFAELLAWVQGKNAPGAFDFIDRDLALPEAEERLLVWFAQSQGVEAITIAWWIEDLNPPQFTAIRTRVGFDAATGSRIQDRAIDLAACETRFDAVEEIPL